jgi:hypothetical protein
MLLVVALAVGAALTIACGGGDDGTTAGGVPGVTDTEIRIGCGVPILHPNGSGQWQTMTAECRQKSANPLPRKQMVVG